jgi:hypothetical protein
MTVSKENKRNASSILLDALIILLNAALDGFGRKQSVILRPALLQPGDKGVEEEQQATTQHGHRTDGHH